MKAEGRARDPDAPARSPWEIALGDRLGELDPALRPYFSVIHLGYSGIGEGEFEQIGTPRRWLWPMLWVLGRLGIVYPLWATDLPFEIRNSRPGDPADGILNGLRYYRFHGSYRTMSDQIRFGPHGLVDRFARGAIEMLFDADVIEGHLELRSKGAVLRVGKARIPIPFAPRVHLVERYDGERQRVALTMDLPAIGRVYEYRGAFSYKVVSDR
ncbi:MAG: DUF4166 domain-containing protein [Pseudolysinimonas sp.]